jgi:predicted enzyme related to lactoylglutathione lyase
MSELISVRPNLEVAELGPTVACLREVLGFQVDVEEEAMGLVLLHRDAVGVAVVRSPRPAANETTAGYIGVTGVEALHAEVQARGAKIVAALTDHPWGLRDFVVEIPGGHRLAFGERIE